MVSHSQTINLAKLGSNLQKRSLEVVEVGNVAPEEGEY